MDAPLPPTVNKIKPKYSNTCLPSCAGDIFMIS